MTDNALCLANAWWTRPVGRVRHWSSYTLSRIGPDELRHPLLRARWPRLA